MASQPYFKLNDGRSIPQIGLGVYRAEKGDECVNAVKVALQMGYRHIDTATYYENEKEVGQGVQESGVPREEIFVTTKVWVHDFGYEQTLAACRKSLSLLDIGYIDLYILHAPVVGTRLDSYRALEDLQKEGVVKSIGVSNFGVHHIDELLQVAKVPPTVNQIGLTPYLQQKAIVEKCKAHDIVVEAYCPLTRGARLDDPVVVKIAEKVGRTVAQVLIRWSVQKGYVVLPKSSQEERIKANFEVFDWSLADEDMAALDGLEDGSHFGAWDPTVWK